MAINKHQKAIKRLQDIIADLKQQSLNIDQANAQLKSHRYIEDNPLFSHNIFSTRSDKFIHYVNETQKKIAELQKHLTYKHFDIIENLLPTIEQQIAALSNAIAANDTIHHNVENAFKPKRFLNAKYKKAAKSIIQPTNELYTKLSEHNEFERRLALMIAEREMLRGKSSGEKNEQLKLEILALHQRLGRCRQAISIIERDIELSEKRTPINRKY